MSLETILDALRALPPTDRRLVAQTILEELGQEGQEPALEVGERDLIDRRLAAYQANPERVAPFEEAIARIEAKLEE